MYVGVVIDAVSEEAKGLAEEGDADVVEGVPGAISQYQLFALSGSILHLRLSVLMQILRGHLPCHFRPGR